MKAVKRKVELTNKVTDGERLDRVEALELWNLFEFTVDHWLVLWQELGQIDRLLIDPPREGAQAVAEALAAAPITMLPKRIVYVSCNPATLARDAAILLRQGRFRLKQAGVVNMFPHTSHVESIAVFEISGL